MASADSARSGGVRMIVTGGGTGGHLFPGIAVAEAMLDRLPGSEVLFVSTERVIDQRALSGKRFRTTSIRSRALKGKGIMGKLRGVLQVPFSLVEAGRVIREFRPTLVLGVGGYVTGPVVLAARLLGVATAIHEQNSVPGLANRLLGKVASRVLLSIPGSESYFPHGRFLLSGNPVRSALLAAAEAARERTPGHTLLVLGGSQGAHRVNVLVVEAVGRMINNMPADFRVIHQAGSQDEEWVRGRYRELGVAAEVAAFYDDMARLYGEADLVVSRAGATSLAEMTVFGRAAILIPYPYAADDHQARNAHYLVEGGGALMYREEELSGATLAGAIHGLMRDNGQRRRMGEWAWQLSRPRATETIVDALLELVTGRRKHKS